MFARSRPTIRQGRRRTRSEKVGGIALAASITDFCIFSFSFRCCSKPMRQLYQSSWVFILSLLTPLPSGSRTAFYLPGIFSVITRISHQNSPILLSVGHRAPGISRSCLRDALVRLADYFMAVVSNAHIGDFHQQLFFQLFKYRSSSSIFNG